MTLPLVPPPSLSPQARPYVPRSLPEAGPDHAEAARLFGNGAQESPALHERDLQERELLGMAMGGTHGLAALRDLRPAEFSVLANEHTARAILDLADAGAPHDAPAVTAELRERGQLADYLDPTRPARTIDPRTYGLGAWQTTALAPETRAPILAREIRSSYRQDRLQQVTQQALQQFQRGLVRDDVGRLEADRLGEVTLELANQLVSLPKELHPEFGVDVTRSVETWNRVPTSSPTPSTRDLGLPSPPNLSPHGQRVIRHG